MKVLVVGAGFSGSTIARVLHDGGAQVDVIDRRKHIGGTAYDERNEYDVLVSSHGAHLFHTNADHIRRFLSRFTEWVPYEHRVLADVHGQLVPVPINRDTVNALYGLELKDDLAVQVFYAALRQPDKIILNSEDQVVSKVGRRLFDLIYRDYTRKQWGVEAKELSSAVAGRLPIRTDTDDRYFSDSFQAQPEHGWTALFEKMLWGIPTHVGVDYEHVLESDYDKVVYTGPIDEFFDCDLGPLPYRSVRFEHETFRGQLRLPRGVINYCGREPFTRRIEWGHFNCQPHPGVTTITTEYPEAYGEPHYPVPSRESWALRHGYEKLAERRAKVVFAGRLGSYRYMTMDQTVGQALKLGKDLLLPTLAH